MQSSSKRYGSAVVVLLAMVLAVGAYRGLVADRPALAAEPTLLAAPPTAAPYVSEPVWREADVPEPRAAETMREYVARFGGATQVPVVAPSAALDQEARRFYDDGATVETVAAAWAAACECSLALGKQPLVMLAPTAAEGAEWMRRQVGWTTDTVRQLEVLAELPEAIVKSLDPALGGVTAEQLGADWITAITGGDPNDLLFNPFEIPLTAAAREAVNIMPARTATIWIEEAGGAATEHFAVHDYTSNSWAKYIDSEDVGREVGRPTATETAELSSGERTLTELVEFSRDNGVPDLDVDDNVGRMNLETVGGMVVVAELVEALCHAAGLARRADGAAVFLARPEQPMTEMTHGERSKLAMAADPAYKLRSDQAARAARRRLSVYAYPSERIPIPESWFIDKVKVPLASLQPAQVEWLRKVADTSRQANPAKLTNGVTLRFIDSLVLQISMDSITKVHFFD